MRMILAADEKWGIGKEGGLLCHLPEDLKYFKEKTLGKTVIMGRVTLESLPGKKGLPGRRNIVLTRDPDYLAQDTEAVSSEEELWSTLTGVRQEDIMVIGGEQIYNALLPFCDVCYVTKIYQDFDADRFFVNLDEDERFTRHQLSDVITDEKSGIKFQFFKYVRE